MRLCIAIILSEKYFCNTKTLVLAREMLCFVRISANSKNVREHLQQIKKRPSKMTTNQNRTGGYLTEKLHLVTPDSDSCLLNIKY